VRNKQLESTQAVIVDFLIYKLERQQVSRQTSPNLSMPGKLIELQQWNQRKKGRKSLK